MRFLESSFPDSDAKSHRMRFNPIKAQSIPDLGWKYQFTINIDSNDPRAQRLP
uniref:Uncharacterized protein n=1 Tax=Candidatus Kentrum sp. SD TaxID=2126332 RepID=A0A450Y5W8_9GAMM|nr:MAG: hypothetical protein BECKSD772F_GA0070984_100732 [Candidatus Kentron sp. SD]VFK40562.1 MAG: hypothetical protein BECKSD772E_GA0070983_100731 [Candidatus Kentron sp. SD]VFK78387.1 MAG: hypothetical protein BECKSD772D_GA0070982_101331 [Candidatus Kentron sp. SD]